MTKIGRPKKEIDRKIFENLCAMQCTQEEICSFLDISIKTLNRWIKEEYGEEYFDEYGEEVSFSKIFAIKRGKGKVSLRRHQWQLSEKSTAMAIFLGKQYLGQSDNIPDPADEEMLSNIDKVVVSITKAATEAANNGNGN